MDYEKVRLATDERTSPEILEGLSRDKARDIRYYVSRNNNTPERVLIRLSKDGDNYVRYRAIHNKNCGGVLREMVKIRLGEEYPVDYGRNNLYDNISYQFGLNRIIGRVYLRFLWGWEERYFHGI